MKDKLAKWVEDRTIRSLRAKIKGGMPYSARVLDLGCGLYGSWDYFDTHKQLYSDNKTLNIADRLVITGVDKRFGTDCVNLENLPDKEFDIVVFSGVIQYLPNHTAAMAEIKRVLRDDGMLIITTVNNECLWRKLGIIKKGPKPDEWHIFTITELKELLEEDYTITETIGIDFMPLPAKLCSNIILACQRKQ